MKVLVLGGAGRIAREAAVDPATYLTNKNVRLIEVRGTWPERNMRLLRAYTRNVGIPFAIAGHLIASGRFEGTGVCAPERALEPGGVFMELARRGIMVHEQITS